MPKVKLHGFKHKYEDSSKQSISEMHGYFSPSKYNSNNNQRSLNQYKVEITHEEVSNENFPDDQDTEMCKKTNFNLDSKINSSNSNFNYNSGT